MTLFRLSRSKLKQAPPGAECRESGTFRSEWEFGEAIPRSTPNIYATYQLFIDPPNPPF
jgi:hypothetical protein